MEANAKHKQLTTITHDIRILKNVKYRSSQHVVHQGTERPPIHGFTVAASRQNFRGPIKFLVSVGKSYTLYDILLTCTQLFRKTYVSHHHLRPILCINQNRSV